MTRKPAGGDVTEADLTVGKPKEWAAGVQAVARPPGRQPRSGRYDGSVPRLSAAGDWVEVTGDPLPTAEVATWTVVPSCGALTIFCGTVRDHSEGRPGVVRLEYDAYAEHVVPRLEAIAESARRRWPEIGRVALLHRVGTLDVGETSVVVAVSTPHRQQAFAAASWCIDTVKATVPIWKREVWEGGSDWGLCTHDVVEVDDLVPGT